MKAHSVEPAAPNNSTDRDCSEHTALEFAQIARQSECAGCITLFTWEKMHQVYNVVGDSACRNVPP